MTLEQKVNTKQKEKATIDKCAAGTMALRTPPLGNGFNDGCYKSCCPNYGVCCHAKRTGYEPFERYFVNPFPKPR